MAQRMRRRTRTRRPRLRRALMVAAGVTAAAVVLIAGPFAWRAGRAWTVRSRIARQRRLIDHYAAARQLDPGLVAAVVRAESKGDPKAVSSLGARGLMQITPITRAELRRRFGYGEGDLLDPDYNLKLGTRYLAYLLRRFDGDRRLALAAYHMGPTRVARLRRAHPGLASARLVARYAGPKTRYYVKHVLAMAP